MKKILFIKTGKQTFIENDIDLLRKIAPVEVFEINPISPLNVIIKSIIIFFKIILWRNKYSCMYIWFPDYHAFTATFAAKITFLPSYIVIGGYDAAKLPDYNYGAHIQKIRSKIIYLICKLATKILPVSEFTKQLLICNTSDKLLNKTFVMYNCIDTDFFKMNPNIKKLPTVLTIASTGSLITLKIKGLDFFKELSKTLPEFEFIIVGVKNEAFDVLNEDKPSNLKIYSFKSKEELLELYQKSAIIAQFSIHESFGVALGEGMACGCVPITIQGLGAAEIIPQNLGFKISKQDLKEARSVILESNDYNHSQRFKISEFIKDNFSKDIRLKNLLYHLAPFNQKRQKYMSKIVS